MSGTTKERTRDRSEVISGKNFKVLHHMVGPWPRDHVLTYDDLTAVEGCDVERLLALEAIEPTDEDPSGPPPVGPENREIIVTATRRVVDAHGHDRPTVAAHLNRAQTEAQVPEDEEVEAAEEVEPVTDIRSRSARPFTSQKADSQSDYRSMKVEDLRQLAVSKGVEGASDMRKAELISALEESDEGSGSGA